MAADHLFAANLWGTCIVADRAIRFFTLLPKRYVGQMFGLWILASAIGGVLAGLLGGEATDGGLQSMSPVFSYMIQYYFGIAVVLVILAYFSDKKLTRDVAKKSRRSKVAFCR